MARIKETNVRMTITFIPILMLQGAYAAGESTPVRKSLMALIDPIVRKSAPTSGKPASEFSLRNCEKHKVNWANVLLMKETASLRYTFAQGCDIEGVIQPAILQSFPVQLKIKNLEDFNRLKADNRITASFEEKPVLNLAVRSARLISKKGEIKFEADYAVKIDLTKQKDIIHEDLGGELRILEIDGKPVLLKEKFKLE